MKKGKARAAGKDARGGLPGPFLTVAVAISLVVGSISFASGSGPEWIALKSSVSLFAIGFMGWIVYSFASKTGDRTSVPPEDQGGNVSLADTGPGSTAGIDMSKDSSR